MLVDLPKDHWVVEESYTQDASPGRKGFKHLGPTRVSCWKLGSMVRINGLYHLLIDGVYWGYNLLLLPGIQAEGGSPLAWIDSHVGVWLLLVLGGACFRGEDVQIW